MSTRENKFPYPPLPEAADGFRVLTIDPGDFSDQLVCTLRSVAFSEKPRYIALSYTWNDAYQDNSAIPTSQTMVTVPPKLRSSVTWNGLGQGGQESPVLHERSSTVSTLEGNKPDPIVLNGFPFFVNHNLHLCMLHLRSPTHALTMWVDAVCINQNDTDEINKQISIMSFIYSRAQKVVAWLGAKPYITQQNPFYCMSMDWKAGETSQLAATLAGNQKMRYTPTMDKHTLSRLADSDYWKRLWIVQEVCLAYELVFVYGSSCWTFDRLSTVNSLLKDIQLHDTDERMRYDAMIRLIEARRARHTDVTRLESLIERFRKQSCSNLRDRVYGLVGMANDIRPFSSTHHQENTTGTEITGEDIHQPLCEPRKPSGDPSRARPRKGRIKIDRFRSFYDLWKDVVTHAFFCAKPSPHLWTTTTMMPSRDKIKLQENERNIAIVRTSGIVQEALGQCVEGQRANCSEVKENLDPASRSISIKAIGYVAGKIAQIGPDYASLVRSPGAVHDWVECWDQVYDLDHDLEVLRAMNEEYMFRIFRYTDKDLARICPIPNHSAVGWYLSLAPPVHNLSDPGYLSCYRKIWNRGASNEAGNSRPRICLGTNHVIALIPPEASVGDLIVRFWNCNAAIVMRPYADPLKQCRLLMMIGRADVARTIAPNFSQDYDQYAEKGLFFDVTGQSIPFRGKEFPDSGAVYVDLDFPTLQVITAFIDARCEEPG